MRLRFRQINIKLTSLLLLARLTSTQISPREFEFNIQAKHSQKILFPVSHFFNIEPGTTFPRFENLPGWIEEVNSGTISGSQKIENLKNFNLKNMKNSKKFIKILGESNIENDLSFLNFYKFDENFGKILLEKKFDLAGIDCRMLSTSYFELDIEESVICRKEKIGIFFSVDENSELILKEEKFDLEQEETEKFKNQGFYYIRGKSQEKYFFNFFENEIQNQIRYRYLKFTSQYKILETKYIKQTVKILKKIEKIETFHNGKKILIFGLVGEKGNEYGYSEMKFDDSTNTFNFENFIPEINLSNSEQLFKLSEDTLLTLVRHETERNIVSINFLKISKEKNIFQIYSRIQNINWPADYRIYSIGSNDQLDNICLNLVNEKNPSLTMNAIMPLKNARLSSLSFFDENQFPKKISKTWENFFMSFIQLEDKTIEVYWRFPALETHIEIDFSRFEQDTVLTLSDLKIPTNWARVTIKSSFYENYGDYLEIQNFEFFKEILKKTQNEEIIDFSSSNIGVKGNIDKIEMEQSSDFILLKSKKIKNFQEIYTPETCFYSEKNCYKVISSSWGNYNLIAKTKIFSEFFSKEKFSFLNFSKKSPKYSLSTKAEVKSIGKIKTSDGYEGNLIELFSQEKIYIAYHGTKIQFFKGSSSNVNGILAFEQEKIFQNWISIIGQFGKNIIYGVCDNFFKMCYLFQIDLKSVFQGKNLKQNFIFFDGQKLGVDKFCPSKFYGDINSSYGFLKSKCEKKFEIFFLDFENFEIPKKIPLTQEFSDNGFDVCFLPGFYVFHNIEISKIEIFSKKIFPIKSENFQLSDLGINHLKSISCIDDNIVLVYNNGKKINDDILLLNFQENFLNKFNLVKFHLELDFPTKISSLKIMKVELKKQNNFVNEAYLIITKNENEDIGILTFPFDVPIIYTNFTDKGKKSVQEFDFSLKFSTDKKIQKTADFKGISYEFKNVKNTIEINKNFTKKKIQGKIYKIKDMFSVGKDSSNPLDFSFSERKNTEEFFSYYRNVRFPKSKKILQRTNRLERRLNLAAQTHKNLTLTISVISSGVNETEALVFFNGERILLDFTDIFYYDNFNEYFSLNKRSFGIFQENKNSFFYSRMRVKDGEGLSVSNKMNFKIWKFGFKEKNKKFSEENFLEFDYEVDRRINQTFIDLIIFSDEDEQKNKILYVTFYLNSPINQYNFDSYRAKINFTTFELISVEIFHFHPNLANFIRNGNNQNYFLSYLQAENQIVVYKPHFETNHFEPLKFFSNKRFFIAIHQIICNSVDSLDIIAVCLLIPNEKKVTMGILKLKKDLTAEITLRYFQPFKNIGNSNLRMYVWDSEFMIIADRFHQSSYADFWYYDLRKEDEKEGNRSLNEILTSKIFPEKIFSNQYIPAHKMFAISGGEFPIFSGIGWTRRTYDYFEIHADFEEEISVRKLGEVSGSIGRVKIEFEFLNKERVLIDLTDVFQRDYFAEFFIPFLTLLGLILMLFVRRIYDFIKKKRDGKMSQKKKIE